MRKIVGIIPCDNGLGHITRSIKLASYLSKQYKIVFFINKKKIKKVHIPPHIKKVFIDKIFNFKKNRYNLNWINKVKKKIYSQKIDFLISDNLPEIIYLNLKCLIIANFFWHEIFKIKKFPLKKLNNTIRKKKIKIFRNIIFKNKKNFEYFGFLGKLKKTIKKENSILISFGSDDKFNKNINEELKKVIYDKNRKHKILLDPTYFRKKFMNLNVEKANFSKKMYEKIKYAIIKPGFGSIQKCLENGAKIFCCTKYFNVEFNRNASAIKKAKLGIKIDNIYKGYTLIKNDYIIFPNLANKRNWRGEIKILNQINKELKISQK